MERNPQSCRYIVGQHIPPAPHGAGWTVDTSLGFTLAASCGTEDDVLYMRMLLTAHISRDLSYNFTQTRNSGGKQSRVLSDGYARFVGKVFCFHHIQALAISLIFEIHLFTFKSEY